MGTLVDFMNALYEQFGQGFLTFAIIFGIIAIVAQWRLYAKADLPGIACIVPVWNFIVFLKLVGRPWHHMFLFLIPGYNIYLLFKVYIELCNAFGKNTVLDYILCIVFNGLYIFNLGMSYDVEYKGPVYGKEKAPEKEVDVISEEKVSSSTSFA